jgi:hypothetical protein
MTKRNLTGILTLVLVLSAVMFGAACNSTKTAGGTSPTDVFKAYYDAAAKKDYANVKKHLSKGSIDLMEIGAKSQGKTFEEAMKESPATGPMPQLSNEKITGETATVDVTADGQKASMPFVKENGEWKIALDKFAISAMGGQTAPTTQTAPPAPSAPSTQSAPPAEKDDEHSDNANH